MSSCEYTFDNVVRIVVVSIVITLLIVGFFISIVWLYLCKKNSNKFKFGMYLSDFFQDLFLEVLRSSF